MAFSRADRLQAEADEEGDDLIVQISQRHNPFLKAKREIRRVLLSGVLGSWCRGRIRVPLNMKRPTNPTKAMSDECELGRRNIE